MIAIIAATGTNLTSIEMAIQRLGYETCITNEADKIRFASHVILPGVGTAKMGMRQLQQHDLLSLIPSLTCPVLGICLGMQLMFNQSAESEHVACLGIFDGTINLLPTSNRCPNPHMGWNQLQWQQSSVLSHGIDEGAYVYFVHSYAAEVNERCLAYTNYSKPFAAIVQKDNFFGMQFHPEKSADVGHTLLKNFCALPISRVTS